MFLEKFGLYRLFVCVCASENITPIWFCMAGAQHGRDPDPAGLRVLRAATGAGKKHRVLRVHQASHRPLWHSRLWQVWRDCGKFSLPRASTACFHHHHLNVVHPRCAAGVGLPAREDAVWRVAAQRRRGQHAEGQTPGGVSQNQDGPCEFRGCASSKCVLRQRMLSLKAVCFVCTLRSGLWSMCTLKCAESALVLSVHNFEVWVLWSMHTSKCVYFEVCALKGMYILKHISKYKHIKFCAPWSMHVLQSIWCMFTCAHSWWGHCVNTCVNTPNIWGLYVGFADTRTQLVENPQSNFVFIGTNHLLDCNLIKEFSHFRWLLVQMPPSLTLQR